MNSYVMYGTKNSTGQKLSHEMFRIHLAKQLLELASTLSTLSSPPSRSFQHQPQQPIARLNKRHFPRQYGKSQRGRQIQLCCAVCSSKKGRGKNNYIPLQAMQHAHVYNHLLQAIPHKSRPFQIPLTFYLSSIYPVQSFISCNACTSPNLAVIIHDSKK